jgi:pilus assembly protein Flp/PilA
VTGPLPLALGPSQLSVRAKPNGSLTPLQWRPAEGIPDMKTSARRFLRNESGATAVEYGLILAGIAIAALTALGTLSGAMTTFFTTLAGKLTIS